MKKVFVLAITALALVGFIQKAQSYGLEAVGQVDGVKGECMGTLVAPDVVLTAAHCLCTVNDNNETDCKNDTNFRLTDSTVISGRVYVHPIASCRIDQTIGETCLAQADLAVIKLDTKVKHVMPITVEHPSIQPQIGEELDLVGFKFQDFGKPCPVVPEFNPRKINLSIRDINSNVIQFSNNPVACKGNSGGPAINKHNRVVGVASKGDDVSGLSMYVRLSPYYDWLSTYMSVALFNAESKKCLDVTDFSLIDYADVHPWACHGLANQLWLYEYLSTDEFRLISTNSGKCLSISRGVFCSPSGCNYDHRAVQFDCDGNNIYERWKKEDLGNGYFRVVSMGTDECLNVSGVVYGADNIRLVSCDGGASQRWKDVVPRMLVAGRSDKCLDVNGRSTKNGAEVIQWECHGGANQLWTFDYVDDIHFMIVSLNSEKCLTLTGRNIENGAEVIQWECHGGANQLWWKARRRDGSFMIVSINGSMLGIYQGSWWNGLEDGAKVVQSDWDIDAPEKQFLFESPSDRSFYLQDVNGKYIYANDGGGGGVSLRDTPINFEIQALIDWNRGPLEDSDLVSFRTFDRRHYLSALDGGGGSVTADRTVPLEWETFKLYKVGEGGGGSFHGNSIRHRDLVLIRTYRSDSPFYLTTFEGQVSATGPSYGDHNWLFRILDSKRVRQNHYDQIDFEGP